MKRADIKVGEDYAHSRSDPFHSYPCSKVTVLEMVEIPASIRPRRKAGVEVRVQFAGRGEERIVATREIRWPWEEEVKRQEAATKALQQAGRRSLDRDEAVLALELAIKCIGVRANVRGRGTDEVQITLYGADSIRALSAALERAAEAKP